MRTVLVLSFLAFVSHVVVAEETGSTLEVRLRLYKITAPVTNVLHQEESDTKEGKGAWEIVASVHETVGNVSLVMEGETLTWDGKPRPDAPGIEILSEPSVVLESGTTGNVAIGQDIGLEYLELRENGLFELKRDPARLGLNLSVKTEHVGEGDEIRLGVKADIQSVSRREPVPGTTLTVGKPIIDKIAFGIHVVCRPREWHCVRVPLPDGSKVYLFASVVPSSEAPRGTEAVLEAVSGQPQIRATIRVVAVDPSEAAAVVPGLSGAPRTGSGYVLGVEGESILTALLKESGPLQKAKLLSAPRITLPLSPNVPEEPTSPGKILTRSGETVESETGLPFTMLRKNATTPRYYAGWSAIADVVPILGQADENIVGSGVFMAIQAHATATEALELDFIYQMASVSSYREVWGRVLLHPSQGMYIYLPDYDGEAILVIVTFERQG